MTAELARLRAAMPKGQAAQDAPQGWLGPWLEWYRGLSETEKERWLGEFRRD